MVYVTQMEGGGRDNVKAHTQISHGDTNFTYKTFLFKKHSTTELG